MVLRVVALAAICGLTACGPTAVTEPETLIFENFGTTSAATGSNGVAFAEGANSYETLGTEPLTLKVIRISRDETSRDVTVILSEETFYLEEGFTTLYARDASWTLGDETTSRTG